jgi:sec-independent protein translocase protein TatC
MAKASENNQVDENAESEVPESDVKMSIWDHIGELRTRLLRAAIGVVVATVGCWFVKERILAFMVRPYEREWVKLNLGTFELQNLSPEDTFMDYLQLSVTGGIILAVPIIFHQLWGFISPGLYREKRFVVPFVLFSTILFISGAAFAYYIMLPFSITFFLSFVGKISESTVLTQRPTLDNYVNMVTRLLLMTGVVFELPLLLTFMSIAGIVTHRTLLRFGRWAILLSVIVGAVVTPGTDVYAQGLVSGALIILYFLSVGLARIFGRKPDPEEALAK